MEIEGGCHCGAVRYRATIDPETVSVCHCTDCQRLSGSPFRVSVPADRSTIELTGTMPRVYEKRADSGNVRRQHFCGTCGAPLFSSGDEDGGVWAIRWGSIDDRTGLEPRRQIWCDSALPWIGGTGRLPGKPHDD
ncbi:GFA family protein [Aureimonas mangrovi]|uniref:GFA family protein n=1 Tax=Aureimonas mangrovi TaxID=2758041 RepID=UPI00163DBEB9|nr:GFA family protein [Aureimonas mangrovi]